MKVTLYSSEKGCVRCPCVRRDRVGHGDAIEEARLNGDEVTTLRLVAAAGAPSGDERVNLYAQSANDPTTSSFLVHATP